MPEKISTSQLAKIKNIEPKTLFNELAQYGYLVRHENKWVLTDLGARFGGEYALHSEYGPFVVWPAILTIDRSISTGKKLSATQLGERVGLNAKKINQLLNELGWIDKNEDGWRITDMGLRAGGEEREDKTSSNYFTVWHDSILKNRNFISTVREFLGTDAELFSTDKSFSRFKHKFEAKHRTTDGHYVRSKGELIIDNWLYMAGLVHAYERKLPIEKEVYCTFYLPAGKVYIEYWGDEADSTHSASRQEKRLVYQENGLHLIELAHQDIDKLDQTLPSALKQFGVKAY